MPKSPHQPHAKPSPPAKAGGVSAAGDELFGRWLATKESEIGRHQKVLFTEVDGARETVLAELREIVHQHYEAPEITAQRLADLGAEKTAAILREELPTSKRGRSGDMGEILATEFVKRALDFRVPIHRLQWKDGREMALRGDDIVAYAGDGQAEELRFLKGEAKSRAALPPAVVGEAIAALDRDKGRPSRHSVLFVATRLREKGEDGAATLLENALLSGFRGAEIEHLLFALCGNNPDKHLSAYLEKYKNRKRKRHAVGLQVDDHAGFIRRLYEED